MTRYEILKLAHNASLRHATLADARVNKAMEAGKHFPIAENESKKYWSYVDELLGLLVEEESRR